jgi:hypothetical protein
VIIGIVAILVCVGLSGCTNSNNVSSKTNKEKILGRWTATIQNTPIIVIMNFFTNESFYEAINETNVRWGQYTITGKTITLQYGDVNNTVDYSFSHNNNTLTLKEIYGGEEIYIVFTKQ